MGQSLSTVLPLPVFICCCYLSLCEEGKETLLVWKGMEKLD